MDVVDLLSLLLTTWYALLSTDYGRSFVLLDLWI